MRCLPLLLVAAIAAVAPDLAGACSCAYDDPRDRLERGEPALIGRVVDAGDTSYVVRVGRAFNVRLPSRVTVHGGGESSGCGFGWHVGQRVGAFLHRSGGSWSSSFCSVVDPDELERALRPYPRPLGQGRLALLAGGRFGDARLMALDRRGRVLGYGFGGGSVRAISVCPGGRAAAELVDVGTRRARVAVRSLDTLAVTISAPVPRFTSEVTCADPAGATVHAAGLRYSGRPVKGQLFAYAVSGPEARLVASRPAESLVLGPGAVYVWSARKVVALPLDGGAARTLARGRLFGDGAVSPDGTRLALWSYDEQLRVIDTATGSVTARMSRYASPFTWLGPDRLLARMGGTARVFDAALQPVRSYRFYRALGQAFVDGTVYGTAGYRLVALDLATGDKGTVGRLPDRGINDLAGVSGEPPLSAPRRRPRRSAYAAPAFTTPTTCPSGSVKRPISTPSIGSTGPIMRVPPRLSAFPSAASTSGTST